MHYGLEKLICKCLGQKGHHVLPQYPRATAVVHSSSSSPPYFQTTRLKPYLTLYPMLFLLPLVKRLNTSSPLFMCILPLRLDSRHQPSFCSLRSPDIPSGMSPKPSNFVTNPVHNHLTHSSDVRLKHQLGPLS